MNLGATELILILVVVLILFGPSKLPGLGKSIGEAIRGFKKGMHEDNEKPAQIVREENHNLNSDRSSSKTSQNQSSKEKQNS